MQISFPPKLRPANLENLRNSLFLRGLDPSCLVIPSAFREIPLQSLQALEVRGKTDQSGGSLDSLNMGHLGLKGNATSPPKLCSAETPCQHRAHNHFQGFRPLRLSSWSKCLTGSPRRSASLAKCYCFCKSFARSWGLKRCLFTRLAGQTCLFKQLQGL